MPAIKNKIFAKSVDIMKANKKVPQEQDILKCLHTYSVGPDVFMEKCLMHHSYACLQPMTYYVVYTYTIYIYIYIYKVYYILYT